MSTKLMCNMYLSHAASFFNDFIAHAPEHAIIAIDCIALMFND